MTFCKFKELNDQEGGETIATINTSHVPREGEIISVQDKDGVTIKAFDGQDTFRVIHIENKIHGDNLHCEVWITSVNIASKYFPKE